MAALDMEKRTGIKHADIDDFIERAKAVEERINDIKSGKVSVADLEAEAAAEAKAKADELAKGATTTTTTKGKGAKKGKGGSSKKKSAKDEEEEAAAAAAAAARWARCDSSIPNGGSGRRSRQRRRP